jgi:hypothetical protein
MFWLFRPIGKAGSDQHQRHADFRVGGRKKLGNPGRGMGFPIEERRATGSHIAVEPQRETCQADHPAGDGEFTQAFPRSPNLKQFYANERSLAVYCQVSGSFAKGSDC